MLEAHQLKESEVDTKAKDGPAFPLFAATGYTGMTLRDYFAAKAMQAILEHGYPITKQMDSEKHIALASYTMANAMLAERAK